MISQKELSGWLRYDLPNVLHCISASAELVLMLTSLNGNQTAKINNALHVMFRMIDQCDNQIDVVIAFSADQDSELPR
jgi:hypothetical protein